MIIFLRSLVFNLAFYGWTAFLCIVLAWTPLLSRPKMIALICWFLGTVAWLERTVLGLRYEVRGRENLPTGPFLVAAKHQSAWETMKLHLMLSDPAVVLKQELTRVPVLGWFATKTQMIPVDRSARNRAVTTLAEGARRIKAQGRPIVIFPQGTRTAPGTRHPYRIGIGMLYEQLQIPLVPMALNSGLFWPRRSFLKYPGTIVVEFLPAIQPGLARYALMRELAERLEAATDRLVVAAGGPATPPPERKTRTPTADA